MNNEINTREIRGRHIAQHGSVKEKNGFFYVPSVATKTKSYQVDLKNGKCTCLDYTFRQIKCKHLYAVQIHLERNANAKPVALVSLPSKKTYAQKWSSYNAAQTSEKKEFQRLLSLLCSNISEPEQENGRPRLPLADMIFACIFKVYSTFSGRRFATDLEAAHRQGFLSKLPSYNSMFRYFEKAELTPILEMLIEASAKPLAALESTFGVDATGLSTTHGFTWHFAKYKDNGRMIAKRDWKKLHIIVGTKTNVICAAKVTDKTEHDSNYFAPLLETASKNFDIKEVSADSAYLSQANQQAAIDNGAFPYIAWKSNSTFSACSQKNELWNNLFHLFSLNRKEFIEKYGKRSNAETTFSMLKAKFGGTLRNKSETAQINEGLAKCVCHNICCLIQSMFELGIKPEQYF